MARQNIDVEQIDWSEAIGEDVSVSGSLTLGDDLIVSQYIKHDGDANTLINFADDKIVLKAGGKAMITMEEKSSSPHEVTINDGSNNIDFVVKGNGSNQGNPGMKFDASTNKLGINGIGTPAYELEVAGDIGLAEYIYHRGDDDTFIRFEADNITLKAGNVNFIELTEDDSQDKLICNNGNADLDFIVRSPNESLALYLNAGNEVFHINHGESNFKTKIHSDHGEAITVNDTGVIFNDDGHATNDFRIESDTNEYMFFVDSGNNKVGIGTQSPDEKLHVAGNLKIDGDAPEVTVKRDNNADASTLQFQGSGGVVGAYVKFLGDESGAGGTNNDLAIGTGATVTERMRIRGDGKVGVGTQSPASELHINGALTLTEKSSDPSNPSEGQSVLWMSDGTGTGDDGDILIKITAGGVTKTVTLVDFSAS